MTEGIATGDAQFVLASASPRRAELLRTLGLRFLVRPTDTDETVRPGELPEALVARLATDKARAGAGDAALPVLAADTVVEIDGTVLGKPRGEADGLAMLAALSGREHRVLSGVAVLAGDDVQVHVSRTTVAFREIDAAEARAYWATGEPADKAGAYGIQGIGGIFVRRLEGSFTGVVGLPVAETEALLRAAGVDCWRHRVGRGDAADGGETS
jgi:septum formation protein